MEGSELGVREEAEQAWELGVVETDRSLNRKVLEGVVGAVSAESCGSSPPWLLPISLNFRFFDGDEGWRAVPAFDDLVKRRMPSCTGGRRARVDARGIVLSFFLVYNTVIYTKGKEHINE